MSSERIYSQDDDDAYICAGLTKESDIWSLGMLVLEAFTGRLPYAHLLTDIDVATAILRGERPRKPITVDVVNYGFDDELWKLLSECWDRSPGRRPKLSRIVSVMQRLSDSWSSRSV